MSTKVKIKSKAKGKAAPKGKAKAAAKASGTTREEQKAADDALRVKIAKEVAKGIAMSDIAEEHSITKGKAAYLQMINEVEDGDVASISDAGDDEKVAARIIAAREKQDEYSSWGWISARVGIPEVRVKKLAEENGYTVKGSHVAKERAEARDAKAGPKTKAKGKKGKKDPSK